MAFLKKINKRAQTTITSGFGENASSYGGRFMNKDGDANIHRRGIGILERISWFHSMLAVSRLHFFLIILGFYITANLFFACIYYLAGVENLIGMQTNSEMQKFAEAFFFSAQTFTTVGYGRISPTGIFTSSLASFEALIGLLTFAVATGLMYGRFSKPTAFLKFSQNALIAPYRNGIALMLRIAPFKNTTLSEAEVRLTIALIVQEENKTVNKFFPLELEYDRINTFNLSWTIVHPITETSPLYGYSEEDIKNSSGEIFVFVKAFDDMFSNTVVARSSYTFNEIFYGAKFLPMYFRDPEKNRTLLDMSRINKFEKVTLPETVNVPV